MIHNGGTSYLVGLLFGGVTGAGAAIFAANAIFNASHSRDSEQRAAGFAIDGDAPARPLAQGARRVAESRRR